MSSQPPEDRSTPSSSKSKQERIRDNQRRSRARRQEYLADLERRLSECQLSAREADLQRSAFIELQIENTRLRELLALAGVNEQFVDHYVSQAVSQVAYPQDNNPALRQLKPKIAPVDPGRTLSSSSLPQSNRQQHSVHQLSSRSAPSIPTIPSTSDGMSPQTPTSSYHASTPFPGSPMTTNAPTTFDWRYQSGRSTPVQHQPQHSHQMNAPQFRRHSDMLVCDTFHIPARNNPPIADENAVLCSVAKQMIEQYNIPPAEMEQVKLKLSEGFCRPAFEGGGCCVQNSKLFEVLNDLSQRYT